MPLPIDKTLTFYIRFNRSIHAELPSNYTIWLRRAGTRWMNCGDAPTEADARAKAEKIARKGKRQIKFVADPPPGLEPARAPRPPALRERGDLISTHEDGVLIVSARPDAPPAPPADGRRCPNFGRHLSDEFNGCADCGVKAECYAAWERAQARAEVEPTKEELFEKALSFGEIPEITLRDKSTGWLRAYIEVYLNEQWRANGKKSRALVRPQWRGI